MTFRAFSFTVRDASDGRLLGLGLVCPEVRYAALLGVGSDHFDRRLGLTSLWKEVDAEIATRLPASPLDERSALVRLLVDAERRPAVVVQPLTGIPADGDPEHSARVLDSLLRGLAARPAMSLKQVQ